MENLWKRKHYQPVEPVGDYELVRKSGLEAYNHLCRRFVPIRNEFIVYKPEWALCGTIDYLCWDRGEDCIAILDWKTNKKIDRENPFQKCIGPLEGLPDCNYIHYSAQLSTYKLLIERMTNLRVEELALVHLKRDGWEYIPCMDLSVEIGAYLGNRNVGEK
jgi:ATP-dependent exoDNAse (exonuclease V) beta subunit